MVRGTTPTLYFIVHNIDDLSTISDIWVTIKGTGSYSKISLTKKIDDIVIDEEENVISLQLTQKETLLFKGNEVNVQLKLYFDDETVRVSSIYKIPLSSPLNVDVMS